jgi:uncharacterized protein (DUF433 family)
MQRVVDEEIMAWPLVKRDGARGFALLSTALAKFYFETNETMTKDARKNIIWVIVERANKEKNAEAIFSLDGGLDAFDWTVNLPSIQVQLATFVTRAQNRALMVRRAEHAIVEDADVMGGVPVFRGTRVPVSTVVASKNAGFTMDQMRDAYAFLTPQLVDEAETYLRIHPRVGRPPKDAEPRNRKLISSKTVALPSRK